MRVLYELTKVICGVASSVTALLILFEVIPTPDLRTVATFAFSAWSIGVLLSVNVKGKKP